MLEGVPLLGVAPQLGVNAAVHRAGVDTRQNGQAVVNGGNGVEMELPGRHGIDDVLLEHQVIDVLRRQQHPLRAGQTLAPADVEKDLDFLVNPADGLELPLLIHRSGDGNALIHGQPGQPGKQRVHLGG